MVQTSGLRQPREEGIGKGLNDLLRLGTHSPRRTVLSLIV